MDSFGKWRKWKLIYFVVNAESYRVVWNYYCHVNNSLWYASIFSKITKNIQNFRSPPPPPPEHFCHRFMYMMIICHWAILHYNMSFKNNLQEGHLMVFFWWFSCIFWSREKILLNSPKTIFVALKELQNPILTEIAWKCSQRCNSNFVE